MAENDMLIPIDQAIELLPDGEYIHTFRNPGGMLVGADWPKVDLVEAMRCASGIARTGAMAQSLKHGLAIDHNGSLLFIETKGETK